MPPKKSRKPSKTQYLWAITYIDLLELRIYVDPQLHGCWAWTGIAEKWKGGVRPFITMHPQCLEYPEILDEILIHEFVHALEYVFEKDLNKPDPANCTQAATIFGRHLPRMLKYLRRDGLDEV